MNIIHSIMKSVNNSRKISFEDGHEERDRNVCKCPYQDQWLQEMKKEDRITNREFSGCACIMTLHNHTKEMLDAGSD